MNESPPELRRICWTESFAFTQLFRSFRLAINPTKLFLAFCGIFCTYLAGRVLDGVWPESAKAVAVTTSASDLQTELDVFIQSSGGGRQATLDWITDAGKDSQRVGPFKLLLMHARRVIFAATDAVLRADLGGLVGAVWLVPMAVLWLMTMHAGYGVLFLLAKLVIWACFGGALSRVAALHAARDERISLADGLGFARKKFLCFFAAPLMPLGVIFIMAVMLFVSGLVGAIPAIGELLAGIFFFLALMAGFVIAFVAIGWAAGFALTYPTIAYEGSDAFDALSRSFSYIYQRPWRTAFYSVLSIVYGAICLLFVKFFVRLALWAVHFFVGWSMNWGSAYRAAETAGEAGKIPNKLDALWQGPALIGDTPFWGGFGEEPLGHVSWLARLLFYLWIFTTVGFVGAFVVSFFYSASALMYGLLRREVDATDLEDVYIEEVEGQPLPTTAPAAADSPAAPGSSPETGGSGEAANPTA